LLDLDRDFIIVGGIHADDNCQAEACLYFVLSFHSHGGHSADTYSKDDNAPKGLQREPDGLVGLPLMMGSFW